MRLPYRLEQLARSLRSRPDPAFLAQASRLLTPAQLLLFRSMKPADQAHGIRVLKTLQQQGETDPGLLAAALLHDVGKTRYPLRVWERALIVICQSFLPERATRWGQAEPAGWQRPFVIAAQHPQWGADMVAEIGGSPGLVELIKRHQDEPDTAVNSDINRELRALQAADNRN